MRCFKHHFALNSTTYNFIAAGRSSACASSRDPLRGRGRIGGGPFLRGVGVHDPPVGHSRRRAPSSPAHRRGGHRGRAAAVEPRVVDAVLRHDDEGQRPSHLRVEC